MATNKTFLIGILLVVLGGSVFMHYKLPSMKEAIVLFLHHLLQFL